MSIKKFLEKKRDGIINFQVSFILFIQIELD
jgi:hypothetical protein